jgi:sulfide:quinone oxidoreductase
MTASSGSRIHSPRPRVVIAGGGVAALEACLALRAFLSESELSIDLLCPADRFEYRPLAVLEPFQGRPTWSMALERFAGDQDAGIVRGALSLVQPAQRTAVTDSGRRLSYDMLLVAAGAEPVRAMPGAVTFRGSRDAEAVRFTLDAIAPGENATIAFVAPDGVFWTLPLYELALLAASRLAASAPRAQVLVATPETVPLESFGPRASTAVSELLESRGVRFVGRAHPVATDGDELELAGGKRLAATAVISLPRLLGRQIGGLARDASGFLRVDEHGRVAGCAAVFAAGDITDFPLKQGGLAAQQADAAAEAMLAELGLPIVPRPFRAVVQGVLYTGREPAYLRAGGDAPARAYSLWWPPSKIAGRYLSPYLTIRAGAPRAPEVRPDADIVPVSVDVASAVQAVRAVVDRDPVPPG